MLAAREEMTMQELVETTTEVYQSLERLAMETGRDVPSLLTEIARSLNFGEDNSTG